MIQSAPIKEKISSVTQINGKQKEGEGLASRPWIAYFRDSTRILDTSNTHVTSNGSDHDFINQDVTDTADPTFKTLTTTGGRKQKITRVTSNYTLLVTDHIVFVNTDSGDVTINYPAGIQGTEYKIVNTGTSGNQVFCIPNGTEKLLGFNSAFTLNDRESLIDNFDNTDGWF